MHYLLFEKPIDELCQFWLYKEKKRKEKKNKFNNNQSNMILSPFATSCSRVPLMHDRVLAYLAVGRPLSVGVVLPSILLLCEGGGEGGEYWF